MKLYKLYDANMKFSIITTLKIVLFQTWKDVLIYDESERCSTTIKASSDKQKHVQPLSPNWKMCKIFPGSRKNPEHSFELHEPRRLIKLN